MPSWIASLSSRILTTDEERTRSKHDKEMQVTVNTSKLQIKQRKNRRWIELSCFFFSFLFLPPLVKREMRTHLLVEPSTQKKRFTKSFKFKLNLASV